MVVAAVAAGVVATAGVASAAANANAADDASDAAAANTATNNTLSRQNLDYQSRLSLPAYRSDATRRAYQDLMLGIPIDQVRSNYNDAQDVGTFGDASGGSGGSRRFDAPEGQMADWAGYWSSIEPTTRNNPTSPWHGIAAGTDGSPEALGRAYATWTNGYGGGPQFVDDPNYVPGQDTNPGDDFLDDWDPQGWLQSTPGYQFRLDEGTKARERSAAARGMLFSGPTMKGLDRYAQDYASAEWDQLFNQLGGGGAATGALSDAGNNYTANVQRSNSDWTAAERKSAYETGEAWGDGLGAVAGAFSSYAGGGGSFPSFGSSSSSPWTRRG